MEASASTEAEKRPKLYLLLNNISKWANARDMISTAKQHGVHEVLIGEVFFRSSRF
jgi:hypothetical protein